MICGNFISSNDIEWSRHAAHQRQVGKLNLVPGAPGSAGVQPAHTCGFTRLDDLNVNKGQHVVFLLFYRGTMMSSNYSLETWLLYVYMYIYIDSPFEVESPPRRYLLRHLVLPCNAAIAWAACPVVWCSKELWQGLWHQHHSPSSGKICCYKFQHVQVVQLGCEPTWLETWQDGIWSATNSQCNSYPFHWLCSTSGIRRISGICAFWQSTTACFIIPAFISQESTWHES